MEFLTCPLDDVFIIKSPVLKDDRGYFSETFHIEKFKKAGIELNCLQDNQSLSKKNVLRGLHFQNPPFAQGKLVRVLYGAALDIIVDIRKKSPTFGRHFKIELNDENHLMLWVPPGFAHGFVALRDHTIFCYKCTGIYNKDSESGIIWNDSQLKIDWETANPVISDKDRQLKSFAEFENKF